MERAKRRLEAADLGERALQESAALIDCLKEACNGQGQYRMPPVAAVLEVISERLGRARSAFKSLTDSG